MLIKNHWRNIVMKSQNASAERRFSPRGMKVAIRAIGA